MIYVPVLLLISVGQIAAHCTDVICLRQRTCEPGNEGRVKSPLLCLTLVFIAVKLYTPGTVDFSEKLTS
jgi:hypothetical protein